MKFINHFYLSKIFFIGKENQMKLAIMDPVRNLLATLTPYYAASFLIFYD
jgi:hypothetical protein